MERPFGKSKRTLEAKRKGRSDTQDRSANPGADGLMSTPGTKLGPRPGGPKGRAAYMVKVVSLGANGGHPPFGPILITLSLHGE